VAIYNPYTIDSNKGEKHLDPFHSHFILIDDDDQNTAGNQRGNRNRSDYRDEIEAKLKEYLKIPIIKIILGGTIDKMFSVENAVSKTIPCLFLEVKPFIFN
jgi:hypothetical protein